MRPVAQVAQLVEQGIENPRVGGSIPSLGTMILKARSLIGLFFACIFVPPRITALKGFSTILSRSLNCSSWVFYLTTCG